jgi:hypothetical protein
MPLGLGSSLIVAFLIARRVLNPSVEERVVSNEIVAHG